MRHQHYIGIDLGGSKIELAVLDREGATVYQHRVQTPQGDYDATLNAIRDLVSKAEFACKLAFTHIGIGTPGAQSLSTHRIKNANSTCLNGQMLQQDLENRLSRDIRISNDANCFTLSEAIDGSGKDCESVFGVILGTGTGGGLALTNTLIQGYNLIAGEWGHNPLPWPDTEEMAHAPQCYCGKTGCIETWLSGPGMSADHFKTTGESLTAQQIASYAKTGNKTCEQTLIRYEHRLARGLAHVINIFDPETIVLGGGLSNIQRLYTNVPERWKEFVFSDTVRTKLKAPTYGDASGVRGAAWLWKT